MNIPPERPGDPALADLAGLRAGAEAACASGKWATRRPVESVRLGGCEVLRVAPLCAARGRVLHFHGGGYRLGMPEMDCPFAEALADACGVEVLLPRYRLAPEHPFPAGLNDGLAAFDAMPADVPRLLSGASAGGGIAAASASLRSGEAAGLMLHSAWLDLSVTAPSYDSNAESDPLFSRTSAEDASALYLQGANPAHPLASPLLADPAGFPPTLISVGSGEVLIDDARAMAERLGDKARLLEVSGMDHVAVTRDAEAPGAVEVFAATCAFIQQLLDRTS
ncbi:alpha/beta hydrolase fold domain-containing protein [Novosphingobium sp.]|uniref:alpha/beta hydrolase fold domain-containing protein n=1 Tax=Novosphingobium sp. TaxID=1874826 RepID=UPI00286E58D4|nr:alpha/beta hydrolase fold domain-containing protein [Novosphingobium sp.]